MNPEILKSKKFMSAILASILAFAGMMFEMSAGEIAVIVAPLSSYILAQGLADHGKERLRMPNR